jgi:hypothetical protein
MSQSDPTPSPADFIADFRAGERTYAEHDEVVTLLATIDKLKSELLHQSMAWEASSIAAESRCQELVEALEEITRLDGNQVGPNIARAALDPTTGTDDQHSQG